MFGETGENPVRARRREACFDVCLTEVPQLRDTPLGINPEKGDKQNAESKYPDAYILIILPRVPAFKRKYTGICDRASHMPGKYI